MADSHAQNSSNSTMIAIGVVVVLIIAVAAVMYRSKNDEDAKPATISPTPTQNVTGTDTTTGMVAATGTVVGDTNASTTVPTNPPVVPTATSTVTSVYKNGTYGADGQYGTPAGQEHLGVTITLTNDVITDVTLDKRAKAPISVRFQGIFENGFKTLVIGKKIDQVRLDHVSGSSLTPVGFNDALDQIKATARA